MLNNTHLKMETIKKVDKKDIATVIGKGQEPFKPIFISYN